MGFYQNVAEKCLTCGNVFLKVFRFSRYAVRTEVEDEIFKIFYFYFLFLKKNEEKSEKTFSFLKKS